MEPFRGKASGKTILPGCKGHPTLDLTEIKRLCKRIADLEAELAPHGAHCFADIERERQRAEKAEAEVERLSLLQKKATPRTEWTPTEEERKILDFAVSRIPENHSRHYELHGHEPQWHTQGRLGGRWCYVCSGWSSDPAIRKERDG